MIKSKKIINQYLDVMYCNKCGAELDSNRCVVVVPGTVSDASLYKYTCKCGWTTTSEKLYPFVRMDFEDEADDTIKTGDEVEAWDTNAWVRFIAWGEEWGTVYGYGENGGSYEYPISSCRKTGRRFELKLIENNAE